jgi:hypothetical protein
MKDPENLCPIPNRLVFDTSWIDFKKMPQLHPYENPATHLTPAC